MRTQSTDRLRLECHQQQGLGMVSCWVRSGTFRPTGKGSDLGVEQLASGAET